MYPQGECSYGEDIHPAGEQFLRRRRGRKRRLPGTLMYAGVQSHISNEHFCLLLHCCDAVCFAPAFALYFTRWKPLR